MDAYDYIEIADRTVRPQLGAEFFVPLTERDAAVAQAHALISIAISLDRLADKLAPKE